MSTAIVKSAANTPTAASGVRPQLIQSLLDPHCYDHGTEDCQLIETHISWVILTGPFAYKIKKCLRLPFLDFSTLEQRKHCCEEELRLNHRHAPQLYLGIVAITGSDDTPRINGQGPVLEYAVKMVQFDQTQRLDNVLARNQLEPKHIVQLAKDLARIHRQAAVIHPCNGFANMDQLRQDCLENFDVLAECADPGIQNLLCGRLRDWTDCSLLRLESVVESRLKRGFIRECHGDLHFENLVLYQNRVLPFDCIEFNEKLRWTDVMSDVAFVMMDLDWRGRPDLGWVFLNAYLAKSGEYKGLALLHHYQVYRAMVRAKVAMLRSSQKQLSSAQLAQEHETVISRLRLAERYTHHRPGQALILSHGLSGSGKSWLANALMQRIGAIQIRSDVERKRCIKRKLYSPEATAKTYKRLLELAKSTLSNGYSVIVDATFLWSRQRMDFKTLARELGVPYLIAHTRAEPKVLEQRILSRYDDPSEATLNVLSAQYSQQEEPADNEADCVLRINTQDSVDFGAIEDLLSQQATFIAR